MLGARRRAGRAGGGSRRTGVHRARRAAAPPAGCVQDFGRVLSYSEADIRILLGDKHGFLRQFSSNTISMA